MILLSKFFLFIQRILNNFYDIMYYNSILITFNTIPVLSIKYILMPQSLIPKYIYWLNQQHRPKYDTDAFHTL